VRSLKQFCADFGWPRIIIFFFLVALFIAAPTVGVRVDASLSDVFNRFGQNAFFVLALVPMIQSGCGLNFGLSLGIIAGLLGATLSVQCGLHGAVGFFGALVFAVPRLAGRPWSSPSLLRGHLVLSIIGIVLLVGALAAAGVAQGRTLADASISFEGIAAATAPWLSSTVQPLRRR